MNDSLDQVITSGDNASNETPNTDLQLQEEISNASFDEDSTTAQEEEGSEGFTELGLEEVEGFDSTLLEQEEVALIEEVSITKEMKNLPCASTLSYESLESVCGTDGRKRITTTTRFPFKAIALLRITFPNGQQVRGTGWFIGPKTLMTSGHCVYSHNAGGWAKKVEVIPAINGNTRPYGSQFSYSYCSVKGWTKNRNSDYDYAAIFLPNAQLSKQTGWFGFANYSASTLRSLTVNNSGYPADKPFGTQHYNAGRITRVNDRKIEYMLDTYGGQSGSPVWRYINGKRYAVGIHGYGGCPNKAIRINEGVYNNMLKWKNK